MVMAVAVAVTLTPAMLSPIGRRYAPTPLDAIQRRAQLRREAAQTVARTSSTPRTAPTPTA
ncbi:hypothetical protein QJS66_12750 [Kocuria rhizophila]|nr:hypothetical protein QJS66_12750 [Kocuria rhizophila]